MLSLIFAMTTWAGPTDLPQITTDLENPIYYTIVNTRSSQPGGYMYFAGENVGLKDEQVATIADKHKFYFTGSHDALYVHNKATGLKLASVGSWTVNGTEWAVGVSPKGGGLAFGPKGGLNGNSCWNEKNYSTDANTSDFTTWSANDAGSIFLVALAEDCEINVDAFYTIECPIFENVQGVKKGLIVNEDGSLGWNTVDLTNKKHYWVPTKVEGTTVALKNVGTGKFLNGTGLADASTDATTVKVLGLGQYNIVSNSTTVHANGHGSGANASGDIVTYGGGIGSASAWQFVEQQDPDAVKPIAITYNFTYNGQALDGYTQTVNTVTGTEYPNITVSFPFGVSATKPEGTIAVEDAPTKTVTIAVEVNLPFKYAADANSIKNWYYIQQHSSAGYGKYLQYAETYIEWADATMTAGEADTYTWAFVGDPFAGFKMVNHGAPEAANAVVSNGEGNPSFGAFADATAWNIKASRTNKDAKYFCLQYPSSNQYMNAQSGKIAFWGDADQGSTMWVTERDMTGLADLQALIDQVDAAVAAYGQGGTTVGYYTAESVDALAAALTTAKAAAKANTSAAANAAAQTTLQNAVAALEIIMPKKDKFYRIVSHCTKDHRANQEVYVSKDGDMHFGKITDNVAAGTIGHIFQFVPANEGKFYIYNVQRGVYMQAVGSQGTPAVVTTDVNKAKPVAIKHLGVDNVIGIYPDGQNMMHAQDASSKIVGWNSTVVTDASAWVITEVADITELYQEVVVSEVGHATLCLGYNATIPAGVEAYAVTEVNTGYVKLTQVEGAIPANEAVILKLAEDASAGTFNFIYAESAAGVENNLLEGTTVDANITEDAYVLGVVENEVGLYGAEKNISTDTTNDGTEEAPAVTYEAWKNNANKAYLPASALPATANSAAFYSIIWGDDDEEGTTAIENVEVVTEDVIYDLSGRRVNEITEKGVYIVNGKKVIK